MKLHVDSGGRRLDIDAPPGRHLSESLAEAGIRLDLRCGGTVSYTHLTLPTILLV